MRLVLCQFLNNVSEETYYSAIYRTKKNKNLMKGVVNLHDTIYASLIMNKFLFGDFKKLLFLNIKKAISIDTHIEWIV